MFKYETHMHTAETSACASATGKEQADRYKELGYDGIIITDHFLNGNCHQEIKDCDDWEKKVDMFMSGYEAAKAIRALEDKEKAAVPIVAMTANAFSEDVKKAQSVGMNAHIAKPIDVNAMVNTLHDILG